MKNIIAALLMAVGIGVAGYLIGNGFVDARQLQRTIEVKGLAEKIVKANKGEWSIRYKVVNNDLAALYKDIENSEHEIQAFLQAQGFKVTEMAIQPQNINDNQGNSYNTNKDLPRYSAEGAIALFTNDVDNILRSSQKVGVLVKQGVVITGTSTVFRYTNLNHIKPAMLVEATSKARDAGQTFANQSESKLGLIKSARQGVFTITGANSNYDNASDVYKRVRVVSTIVFLLNQ